MLVSNDPVDNLTEISILQPWIIQKFQYFPALDHFSDIKILQRFYCYAAFDHTFNVDFNILQPCSRSGNARQKKCV